MYIRKWIYIVDETISDGGPPADIPLKKAAVAAVVRNPYANRWSEDLSELLGPSGELARELVNRCVGILGSMAEGCGKAALVGVDGEQEHGAACLTTPFGDALRDGIGGTTWVASTTKVSGVGASIDIPLANKNALFVREYYDTLTLCIPDAPRSDEIVVAVALSNRGRVHHRIGGLTRSEATKGDGLR